MTYKVGLDAGHSFYTKGKRTPNDEREWTFNNKVLLACQSRLNQYRDVEILRLDDPTGKTDIPLTTRTNKANAWKADILVSIHHNANTGKWGSWGGTETFTSGSVASRKLANCVHPRIVKAMGLRDRGVKVMNLHMLRESIMPSVLTEGAFMDSTTDITTLRDDSKLREQGEAIADGIASYFGLTLKNPQQVASAHKPKSKAPNKKEEEEELKFTSGTLKKETEFSLSSKAHRELIVEAAIKSGYSTSWRDKLKDGTITDGDLLALAAGTVVKENK